MEAFVITNKLSNKRKKKKSPIMSGNN